MLTFGTTQGLGSYQDNLVRLHPVTACRACHGEVQDNGVSRPKCHATGMRFLLLYWSKLTSGFDVTLR
jgi:hypothetical protein